MLRETFMKKYVRYLWNHELALFIESFETVEQAWNRSQRGDLLWVMVIKFFNRFDKPDDYTRVENCRLNLIENALDKELDEVIKNNSGDIKKLAKEAFLSGACSEVFDNPAKYAARKLTTDESRDRSLSESADLIRNHFSVDELMESIESPLYTR